MPISSPIIKAGSKRSKKTTTEKRKLCSRIKSIEQGYLGASRPHIPLPISGIWISTKVAKRSNAKIASIMQAVIILFSIEEPAYLFLWTFFLLLLR